MLDPAFVAPRRGPDEKAPVAKEDLQKQERFALLRFTAAVLMHGLGTGFIGICVARLISTVQVLGFGDYKGDFLVIASSSPPWRRFVSVVTAGVFGALAWFALRGMDPGFVPVDESMDKGAPMPVKATVINAMIQDIVVALGGSFGREAAPREVAAMYGGHLADLFRLSARQRRVMISCGAGAGLAAVYCVPISGVFYIVEHMLRWDLSISVLLPAIVTSGLAVAVASVEVPTEGLYHMPLYSYQLPSLSILLWALLAGPVAGIAAALFRAALKCVRERRPKSRLPVPFKMARPGDSVHLLKGIDLRKGGPRRFQATVVATSEDAISIRTEDATIQDYSPEEWAHVKPVGGRDAKILVVMPMAFLLLAALSLWLPSLLGNGRALAEVAFKHSEATTALGSLLLLKTLVTLAAIGSGVDGGTLTPSVALGATLGALVMAALPASWPGERPANDQAAVVMAAAFLAAASRSPVTSGWLLIEFSAQGIDRKDLLALLRLDWHPLLRSRFALGMLVPVAISICGACVTEALLMKLVSGFRARARRAVERPVHAESSVALSSFTPNDFTGFEIGVPPSPVVHAPTSFLSTRSPAVG